jgi:DNA-binding response OmpR family regulator
MTGSEATPTPPGASPAGAVRDLLLVDPDERSGRTLQRYLEEHGWIVARARDTRGALRAWSDLAPRLLVTELDGQDLDGFGLLDVVATSADRPPVLVFSHHAAAESLSPQVLRSLGIDVALSRPCRFGTVAAVLEALFDQRYPALSDSPQRPAERGEEEEPSCPASPR